MLFFYSTLLLSALLPQSPQSPPRLRYMVTIPRHQMLAFVFASVLIYSNSLFAQLPQTRLYSVSPAGGQIGQELEVKVLSGADLDEVSSLHFSHPKITARQKTTESNGQQIPVANTFVVTIPVDVPVGVYEVRCGGLFGFSNPRRFAVDQAVAITEPADNNSAEKATLVELGQVVNGRLESGNDVDWFRFSATKGQRVVIDTWAERLDSRMNPVIALYDSSGRRRLDWSRNSVGNDPVLVFDVPADGDYCLQLRDVVYSNGNDYFYRLHISTNPHLEFVWPPAGQAGTTRKFTLFGYNLPGGTPSELVLNDVRLEQLNVDVAIPGHADLFQLENRVRPAASGTDAFSYRFQANGITSNPVRVGISPYPTTAETEPNNQADQAQLVTDPISIGGQFGQPGDVDHYRFQAKAGEVYYIEVLAERLGTSADPYLIVNQITQQKDGAEQVKRLTAQDDVGTNLLANIFETNTDDPVFRLQVPADGTYEVVVRDRYWESRGSAALRYSVEIRPESPDFRVVAVPTAPTAGATWPTGLRQGDQFALNLLAFRQDGYTGPIQVSAKELPAGLQCKDVIIGENETTAALVIQTANDAPVGLHSVQLISSAVIDDPALNRSVASAQNAVAANQKPIADLQKKLDDAAAKRAKAQTDFDAASKAAQEKPDDANLKANADKSTQLLDQATAVHTTAKESLAAAQQKVQQSQTALAAAQKAFTEGRKQVSHPVRCGTVVWSSAANVPAISRTTSEFTLSVMAEAAPFQIHSEAGQFTVNQGRQLLIPLKIEKRNGFDNKVTLTAQGVPKKSNIDFPNSALEKGENEKTLAMLIKDNTPPGSYTIWMNTQGQVSYSRNPALVERKKKESEAANAKVNEAKQSLQAATEKKNQAVTAINAAQKKLDETKAGLANTEKALQKAKADSLQAKKDLEGANATTKKIAEELQVTEDTKKKLTSEIAELKQQAEKFNQTAQQKTKLEQELAEQESQAEDLQKQSADQPDNQDLSAKLQAAQKKRDELKQNLQTVVKKFESTKAEAAIVAKQLSEKQQGLANQEKLLIDLQKKSADAKKTQTQKETIANNASRAVVSTTKKRDELMKAIPQLEAKLKEFSAAKTQAETDEKSAQALVKSAEGNKAAADKALKDAENAAKPKNLNFTPPTTPIVVTVKPAPIKLTASVPNGGKVKKGASIELVAKVTRQNGFAGPVQVDFTPPPGVAGFTSTAVTIPPDQTEAKLSLQATDQAPEGKLAFGAVTATMDFEGKAEVDTPVTIEVTK